MKEEKKIKELLQKSEGIETGNRDELRDELRKRLQELRDSKMFPRGYAKTINKKLGITDRNKVYHVISGVNNNFDLQIATELINLALEKKQEEELIEKADKILGSK